MSGRAASRRQAEIAVIRPAQPRSTPEALRGATERRLAGAMEVPIDQVIPDPGQPRRDWVHDDGERRLAELADSIREFGVIQPLLVREEGTLPDGRQQYAIIAGGRRHAAALRAGLALVPVVIRGEESTRIRILQLVENLQRQNLSPLDEARAYQELIDLEGLNPPALADRLHVSAQHVRDRLRVLADQVLADAVERRQISNTAAREIMKLPDEEVQRFRDRVVAGERLQTNDVAAARARLAAEGVINPRRKGGRPTEPPAPAGEQTALTGADTPEQTPFVPGSLEGDATPVPAHDTAGAAEQTPFVSVRAEDEPGVAVATAAATVPGAGEQTSFVPDGGSLPAEAVAMAERVAEALDRTLWGDARQRVRATLEDLADEPARAAWWLRVDAELRERLRR